MNGRRIIVRAVTLWTIVHSTRAAVHHAYHAGVRAGRTQAFIHTLTHPAGMAER